MPVPKSLILLLTVLLFSCGNNQTDKPIDTVKKITKPETVDPELLSFWTRFKEIVAQKNYREFKTISLDSLQTCDTTLAVQTFLNKCYSEVFDSTLLKKIVENTSTYYFNDDTQRKYFSQSQLEQIGLNDSIIILRRFQIEKELTPDGAWTMAFDFVKTKRGYRFYGCDCFGGPICCR